MVRCASALCAIATVGFIVSAGSSAGRLVAAGGQAQAKPTARAAALPTKNPIASSEASIKTGRGVYIKFCAPCHGLQGKGDGVVAPPGTKPANLADATWVHGSTDPEIFKVVKEGVGPAFTMAAMGKLVGDNDIWHTINFLRDLAKRSSAAKK